LSDASIVELDVSTRGGEIARVLLAAYSQYATRIGPQQWERMRAGVARAEHGVPGSRVFASTSEGALSAVVFYFPPGCSDPTIFEPDWASIRLLGVDPAVRGGGAARRLTQHCIAQARADGAATIGLHTSEAMTIARGLYERMGFRVDREIDPRFGLRYWRFRLDL
jgi:ribosomal protein S18 acetylase RimI-like enzyme